MLYFDEWMDFLLLVYENRISIISENNTSPNNDSDKKNSLNLSILNNINNTNKNNNNNFKKNNKNYSVTYCNEDNDDENNDKIKIEDLDYSKGDPSSNLSNKADIDEFDSPCLQPTNETKCCQM